MKSSFLAAMWVFILLAALRTVTGEAHTPAVAPLPAPLVRSLALGCPAHPPPALPAVQESVLLHERLLITTPSPEPRSREFTFSTGTRPTPFTHASSLVRFPDGDTLVVWFGGSAEGKPDTGIWAARRTAAGGVWQHTRRIAKGLRFAALRWRVCDVASLPMARLAQH